MGVSQQASDLAEQAKPWSRGVAWWVVLVEGVIAFAIGLFFVFAPEQAGVLAVQFVGLYLLVVGALTVFRGLRGRGALGRDLQIMSGTVGITVGLLTALPPLFWNLMGNTVAINALIYILATGLVLEGVIGVVAAIALSNDGIRWAQVAAAVLFLLIGALLFYQVATQGNYTLWIGVAMLVGGAGLAVYGFLIRRRAATATIA